MQSLINASQQFFRLLLPVVLAVSFGYSTSAQADPRRGGGPPAGRAEFRGPGPAGVPWQGGGREIQRFHERDVTVWRSGGWYHGYYGGRLAWWWVVGGVYYFYPSPIYPYPDPYIPGPVLVAPSATTGQPQNTPPVWYYCEPAGAYYPYVAECPSGWKTVPATPATPAQ